MLFAMLVFACNFEMNLCTYISGASNIVCSGFCLILDISSFIGQILVNQILVILGFTNRLLELITKLFGVIFKDSVYFFRDVTDSFSRFIELLVENIFKVSDGLMVLSSAVNYVITTSVILCSRFISFLSSCLSASSSFLKSILIFLLDGGLCIGSMTSLAIKNTLYIIFYCITKPFQLVLYLLYSILMVFMTVIASTFNGVYSICIFICSIPFNSIFDLTLTIIILYLIIKNYKTICIFTLKTCAAFCLFFLMLILLLGSLIYRICIFLYQLCSRLSYMYFTRPFPVGSNALLNADDLSINNELSENYLCVVCKINVKDVIVLPCRHLCLCVNCKMVILNQFNYCPICRTFIEDVMEVYV